MFSLALSILQHIGSFNTSHFDILNWLAKIDMAWVKASFKAVGGEEEGFHHLKKQNWLQNLALERT